MPNTKSAEKAVRQSEKKRMHNKSFKSAMRTQTKKFITCMEKQESVEKTKAEFLKLVSLLDKIGHKNILHVNNTNRKKAKLHSQFNQYIKKQAEKKPEPPKD
jgi:small subunit ribosomal protein S20